MREAGRVSEIERCRYRVREGGKKGRKAALQVGMPTRCAAGRHAHKVTHLCDSTSGPVSTHLHTGVGTTSVDCRFLTQTCHLPYLRRLLRAIPNPPPLLIVPADSKPSERESGWREGPSQPTVSGIT